EGGQTAAGGLLLLDALEAGRVDVRVSAPHFREAALRNVVLEVGSNERFVRLQWVPTSVRVEVADGEGEPVDAEIRFDGPDEAPGGRTGPGGVQVFELRPGSWQVLASSASHGA